LSEIEGVGAISAPAIPAEALATAHRITGADAPVVEASPTVPARMRETTLPTIRSRETDALRSFLSL
jgi:hypothetical protein